MDGGNLLIAIALAPFIGALVPGIMIRAGRTACASFTAVPTALALAMLLVLAPAVMRGEVIGHVDVALAGRSPTPEEEAIVEAVVDQASLALENARLYQETQRRAAYERLVSEITDKLRRATDMDTLMQTAIREMATALDAPSAFVQLSALPSSTRRGALSSISRDPPRGEEVENS